MTGQPAQSGALQLHQHYNIDPNCRYSSKYLVGLVEAFKDNLQFSEDSCSASCYDQIGKFLKLTINIQFPCNRVLLYDRDPAHFKENRSTDKGAAKHQRMEEC